MWYREVDDQTNEVKSPCDPENEVTKIAPFRYRTSYPFCVSRTDPSGTAGILLFTEGRKGAYQPKVLTSHKKRLRIDILEQAGLVYLMFVL